MEATKTERKNRSRKRRKKSTGILIYTEQDALGFAEPLARYVDLPSSILGQFYNLMNGKPATSRYYLERLTDLFHETEELPASRCLLYRPPYQDRHGINHAAIYRKSLGTALVLFEKHVYDKQMLNWLNNTHLMNVDQDTIEPEMHDQELAIVAASIELEARRDRGYFTHIDILKTASSEAQKSNSPLAIPVDKIEHLFPGQSTKTVVRNTHVKSDNLFGLPVLTGAAFFVIEHDRHTEIMEPTKGLWNMSWLKKILMYSAISTGDRPVYQSYLGIPNLRILATFQGPKRQAHFNELVRKYARWPKQFASTVLSPIDFIINPHIIPSLYREPVWMKHDGTMFSLKERR